MSKKLKNAFKELNAQQLKGLLVSYNKFVRKEIYKNVHKKKKSRIRKVNRKRR